MYKNPVSTSQNIRCFSIAETYRLMLLREITAVYFKDSTEKKNISALLEQNSEVYRESQWYKVTILLSRLSK